MRSYSFQWLDVFAAKPFAGNALAVFPDASGLSDQEMVALAKEINMSEITFVLKPSTPAATYRARIFTPGGELAFAGHPTLGTAAALVHAGVVSGPRVVQETLSGLTSIEVMSDRVVMEGPPASLVTEVSTSLMAEVLGLSAADVGLDGHGPAVMAAGVKHLLVPVRSPEVLAELTPDTAALIELSRELGVIGAYPFALLGPGNRTYARARLFMPLYGIPEDPATGSAAALLGSYLHRIGRLPRESNSFWYEQGIEMGRPSELWVEVLSETRVRVGGQVQFMGSGQFTLA